MAGFFLSGKAKADVKEIGRYTQQRWGVEQRHRYLGELDACFQKIGANPTLGNSAEAIRACYRRICEGSHVVFFRKTGNEVEIVRVLHERMLPGKHLP
ncbi:MAG TPA: type II toxin-antitoxin system RelE/ParE family toxin [Polyangia bacterium]|nr:type II toxin-antitoxin system RelE/ParE family toxin [Polyangia bacterium]